uniref:Cytohesin Ubiquitin Protein Inducing domain-containing protein n=1 Tax=Anopheles atroparvus TaxID=41427 RepID=A0AAG5DB89_ANOAO
MGDAKVKQQAFFGAQSHHHHQHHHHHHLHESSASGATLKGGNAATASSTATMTTVVMDSKHATSTLMGGGSPQQTTTKEATMAAGNAANVGKDKSPGSLKYDQLKARKQELEKRLNEKYSQLQQIKREEAQLIGMYPSDFSCGIGPAGSGENGIGGGAGGANGNGTAPTLRRKIGTSFKLPENLLNNKEDDINKLLLEKQIQQQISEASLRLANDSGQPKSVRRTHKQNYEMAQQKLLAINQNLSVLKKRQQQKEQQQQQQQQQQQLLQQSQHAAEHKPTARDDIDLHKTAQVNRFRSNSNSSSMLMHSSERRNSVKSNTSSNASGSIAGHHHMFQHQHHQQQQQQHQMLQVQIPGGHYHVQHQQGNQQISPYSIHSGIIPSGSQSMTSAASAAMISQLSMLRHRARTDSFPGIATSYDTTSTGSGTGEQNIKISPLSASGSIVSGGSSINQLQQAAHGHHHPHHHHHQVGPGPARMNRLIQQQIGINYSPPPPPGTLNTTPGYVLSPTGVGNGPQAFVYDAKVISRLQGNGGGIAGNNNILHSPQGVATATSSSSYGHLVNDQNYCPNQMVSTTPTGSGGGGGYDHGSHEAMTVPSSGGLGGYWMSLDNGEKVWCSVDSRQFSSLDRKQQGGVLGGSMKLSRTSTKLSDRTKSTGQFTTAVKSSSLGNFQEAIGKSSSLEGDEMISIQPDAISVTSGSSEHKKREKVWRETSLDSPVVKHKALPPVPPQSGQGQMSPSSTGSGHLQQSPNAAVPQSPPYMQPALGNASIVPLHINTNVSGYGGPSSPLLLSPQQMRYYQQRQQQLLERQRKHHQLQQQHQQQQHMQQQQQQHMHHQQRLMMEEQQQHMNNTSARQREIIPGGSLHPSVTMTTAEPYNPYNYQQQQQQQQPVPPPYHSRHHHPPPPPLPPQNEHHYHHSQQQQQSRLEHPPPPPAPLVPPAHPQHLDLLPQSYAQQLSDRGVAHLSPTASHHRMGPPDGHYYPHRGQLSSRHPDLLISPTLSQSSSQTLTSPTATAVVQALPIVGGLEDNGSISPTPSMPGGTAVPSDIQMESPKNMTVVQQGKIMPYKEVTKPFEMSDFYKYSTKYRQKQQQQQQQQHHTHIQQPQQDDCNPKENDVEPNGSSTGDGIHKGIYQPPNRSICQPIVNNYN